MGECTSLNSGDKSCKIWFPLLSGSLGQASLSFQLSLFSVKWNGKNTDLIKMSWVFSGTIYGKNLASYLSAPKLALRHISYLPIPLDFTFFYNKSSWKVCKIIMGWGRKNPIQQYVALSSCSAHRSIRINRLSRLETLFLSLWLMTGELWRQKMFHILEVRLTALLLGYKTKFFSR